MDLFEYPSYALVKRLSRFLGIWPYQSKYYKVFIYVFVFSTLLNVMVAETHKIIDVWGNDYDTAFEVLPSLLCTIMVIVKYLNGMLQTKKIASLFDYISNDHKRLMNIPEYQMLYKHMILGRQESVNYLIYLAISMSVYLLFPTAMNTYYYMHPINGTVKKDLLYEVDYGVDNDEYFIFIMFLEYVGTLSVIAIIAVLDTLFFNLIEHGCGLFAVAGFRLKTLHVLKSNIKMEEEYLKEQKAWSFTREELQQIQGKLVLAIQEHRMALEFIQLLQSTFSVALFLQLFLGMLAISVSGILVLMKLGSIQDLIRVLVWVIGQLFHFFILCYPGQKVENASEQLYFDSLEAIWYTFSKQSNVLYQFVVMNSQTPCKLVALTILPINMETYMTFMNTAMSYFTVLSSTR